MSVPQQTREVDKVKRSENGIITDPITLPPTEMVGTARRIMEQHNITRPNACELLAGLPNWSASHGSILATTLGSTGVVAELSR